jgi:hypothetical protein
MKTIFSILFITFFQMHVLAAPPVSTASGLAALRTSMIPKLELDHRTFDEAFLLISQTWKQQHPELEMPVAIVEFRNPLIEEEGASHPRIVTMRLTNVTFIDALRFLCDSSYRRLVENPTIVRIEERGPGIIEEWDTQIHKTPESVLQGLGLGRNPSAKELVATYSRYGLKFEEWTAISYASGTLIVTATQRVHQQVAGINLLLENGFEIRPKTEQE